MGWLTDIQDKIGKDVDNFFAPDEHQTQQKQQFEQQEDDSMTPSTYKAQKGDNLWKIAKNLGVPLESLHRSGTSKYLQIGEDVTINPMGSPEILEKTQRGVKELDKEHKVETQHQVNDLNSYNYIASPGDTLSGIAKKLGVDLKGLQRSRNTKYLQIGEKVTAVGYKPELVDLGGDDNALSAKPMFAKLVANSFLPESLDKDDITNKDFTNNELALVQQISKHFAVGIKEGGTKLITVKQYNKYLDIVGAGYDKSIAKDTGNPVADSIRTKLGAFTVKKTKEGFEVIDQYDFSIGDWKVRAAKGEYMYAAHLLGEMRMGENEDKSSKDSKESSTLKVRLKLPKSLLKKLHKI